MTGVAIAAAGIGAAGSIAGAGMGMASSSAANKANQKMMEQLWAISQGQAKPYQQFGKYGMDLYRQMLPQLLAQSQYQQFTPEMYAQSPLYTPMVRNLAELQATPGYQFQLEQGQKELGQSAAARGGLLSGAQLKAAQGFGQKQAATGFQDAWQRAQNAYMNAFNTYNAGQSAQRAGAAQQANMLGNITNIGYTAAMRPTEIAAGIAPSAMSSNTYAGNQAGNAYGVAGSTIGNLGGFALNQYDRRPVSSYGELNAGGGKPAVL
jgi:hypothetical protein